MVSMVAIARTAVTSVTSMTNSDQPACGDYHLTSLCKACRIAIQARNIGPSLGERSGDNAAQTRSGAGNQRDLSGQSKKRADKQRDWRVPKVR